MGVALWLKRILGLLLALAISAGLWWMRPAAAEPAALAVVDGVQDPAEEAPADGSAAPEVAPEAPTPDSPGVTVSQDRSSITMARTDAAPTKGLVFYQGALVDPRAYAKILEPIAEAGYLVKILKAPFDLAIIDIGAAGGALDAHPGVAWWAVGGHSMGGVAASTFASGSPRRTPAVLLWGSYPFSSLADVDVAVLSVSGTEDGLTTPSDIEASKAKLPPDATFVAVEGAVHSYFGDYGEQRGDGTPTIPKDEAQAQIVQATLEWLNSSSNVA